MVRSFGTSSLRGLVGGTRASEATNRDDSGVRITCTAGRADDLLVEKAHFC